MTWSELLAEIKKHNATRIDMSAETPLSLLRSPGDGRCFTAFGVRINLVDEQEGIRFVTAREELGLPPAAPTNDNAAPAGTKGAP